MLAAVPDPRVRGNANHLPFCDGSFRGVTALYILYHLDEPRKAIAKSHRILNAGGLFVASAPSRNNDPELIDVLGLPTQETFDAENGPELVEEFFGDLEIERWDEPLVHLPDKKALELYLQGRQLAQSKIDEALETITTPLHLTKRETLIYGRKL